jgi:hypothetical protein
VGLWAEIALTGLCRVAGTTVRAIKDGQVLIKQARRTFDLLLGSDVG